VKYLLKIRLYYRQKPSAQSVLIITAKNVDQMAEIAKHIEGNLTGGIYSHTGGKE